MKHDETHFPTQFHKEGRTGESKTGFRDDQCAEKYVWYISHEDISGGREHDGGYVPESFHARGAHRKSHQCAIKSACVVVRIVLTLHLFWLYHASTKSLSQSRVHLYPERSPVPLLLSGGFSNRQTYFLYMS